MAFFTKSRILAGSLYFIMGCGYLLFEVLNPSERAALFNKMFGAASTSLPLSALMVYGVYVLLIGISIWLLSDSYKRQTARFPAKMMPGQNEWNNISYYKKKYDEWCSDNLHYSSLALLPSLIGMALVLLWIYLTPEPAAVIDSLTPTCKHDGWILTTIVGIILGTSLLLPITLLYRLVGYYRFDNIDISDMEDFCDLIKEFWDDVFPKLIWLWIPLAAFYTWKVCGLVWDVYSLIVMLLSLSCSMLLIIRAWPESKFDAWERWANREYSEYISQRPAFRDGPDVGEGYGSSGGGGGGGGGYSSRQSERIARQTRARQRQEAAERREQRRRENATKWDCAYYKYGIGKEGCSYWGTCADVTGPCKYEMSPGSCPHFRHR